MKMFTFVKGPIDANNYLLMDEKTNDGILIDCSSPEDTYIDEIKKTGVNLKKIILTHGHFDHILGCNRFYEEFGCDIYVGKDDIEQINYAPQMTLMLGGVKIPEVACVKNTVEEEDIFVLGDFSLKAISTPGHTKGGMSYLSNDGKLFSGDTLFKGSVGRTDFLGGSFDDILNSVKNKLFKLPDDTVVYTGHGPSTTIGYEKTHNEIAFS
ncbi:MAG: MBL fold metallo-hydrolase [Cyanobacteriota bacterium]|nr:MBL fold metallo-hydrolase [Cyanobacteriota bacterium]